MRRAPSALVRAAAATAAVTAVVVGPAQAARAAEPAPTAAAPPRAAAAAPVTHGSRAPASASFTDQRVTEVTTSGSQGVTGLAFHLTHAGAVAATNVAVARTTCDGCRAVALSFQVVVADAGPASLDVGNAALALNEGCTGCESVAVAYQLVLVGDRRMVLTEEGRRELADLRDRLRRLARSDRSVTDIQVRAERLMTAVGRVLADELRVRARARLDHDVEQAPPAAQRG